VYFLVTLKATLTHIHDAKQTTKSSIHPLNPPFKRRQCSALDGINKYPYPGEQRERRCKAISVFCGAFGVKRSTQKPFLALACKLLGKNVHQTSIERAE